MKILYKILGGILVLAIFFAFLFSLYKGDIEKSNLTDWISAFCNLAMAAAALGGYLIAKDWQRQKMDEDAYQLSKQIVLHNYRDIANVHSSIYGICDYYGVMIAALPQRGKEYMPTLENIREYNEKLYSIYELRRTLDDNIIFIEKLGWAFKEKLNSFYDDFTSIAFGKILSLTAEALSTLEKIRNLIDENDDEHLREESLKYLKLINELRKEQNKLDEKYKFFKSFSITVKGYFEN